MKRFFLIPLMALMCSVMAWGEDVNYPNGDMYTDFESAITAAGDGGKVTLTDNVTLTSPLEISQSLTLDLAHHTLTVEGMVDGTTGCSSSIANGISVTIKNGTYMGRYDGSQGAGIKSAGNLVLKDCTIDAMTNAIVQNGGSLDIDNVTFQNVATTPLKLTGNVSVTYANTVLENRLTIPANATFTMNSGTISYNGTVILMNGSTLTINGGTISNNSSSGYGIQQNGGNLIINDGTIQSKKAGILVYGGTPSIQINGGSIIAGGVNGKTYGIWVFSTPAHIEMYGGTINNNNGSYTAYGIFLEGGASLEMKGGSIDVQSNYNGAGVVIIENNSSLAVTGGTITGSTYGIAGNGSNDSGGTAINISGGSITGTNGVGIYHPQQENSTLTITDGNITGRNSAIEMRAGTLDIDGGNFTATATEFLNVANSNGTTTMGAALAVAQHTTLQPINIDISGGIFRGIYPIAQANPQENAQEFIDHVNIAVSGGQFWATNTADVAAYTENNKLRLTGGYYNLAPHAFVANGYVAINNPDPNPSAADGYLFKVVQLVPEDFESTLTEGNWVVEDTWKENESVADHIPTQHTNVTIPDGGNVYVQPTSGEEVVAYAHNLTLEGNATLTVKDGATLVLGNEATVPNTANLVVKAGGQLLIAPSESEVQPVGSVTLVADGAGLKEGKSDHTDPANLYWQHFAIPTVGAPTSIALSYPNGNPITEAITYYNTWDIVNGWESIVKTDLTEPFVGYNFSNIKDYGTDVNYTFTGQLVGNASSPLNFTRRGFNFFGNSYLAPINIQALQSSMYEQGFEFTVYIFTKQGKKQTYRAINEVTASIYGIDEIKPLQGFFMFAEKATQADFQYNSAVYSAFINKQNGGAANNAPARRAASQYDAKAIIGIESAEGEYDEVVLVASNDFSDEYDLKADARKMENAGMNIYADGSFDYLAVMATNDLMGQTLSFKAGNEAQYTMTFSGIKGELALRDNATGAIIAMEEGASYEFAAQPNSTIEGRFEIVGRNNAPTAIDNTEVKANVKGIYTLTGQYVGEDFKALPAGVYVVNGVKIVK